MKRTKASKGNSFGITQIMQNKLGPFPADEYPVKGIFGNILHNEGAPYAL
ncbi:MAG: hypothetical protein QT04_C0043G0010, partial [archaeon GW2011_AR11]